MNTQELRIDVFSIDFEKMQDIYEKTLLAEAESEAAFEQYEKCSGWSCDHPRYFANGTPAVTKDGKPDKRGKCKLADEFFRKAQSKHYEYGLVNLVEFFKEIGLKSHG